MYLIFYGHYLFCPSYSSSVLIQCPGCDTEKGERRKKSEILGRTFAPPLIGRCVATPPSNWSPTLTGEALVSWRLTGVQGVQVGAGSPGLHA